jgi:hypothetical protein
MILRLRRIFVVRGTLCKINALLSRSAFHFQQIGV